MNGSRLPSGGGLKLTAEDEEDLRVFSAHLQDAVAKIGEMAFDPKRRCFVVMANRFCWERAGDRKKVDWRVRSALQIDGVLGVKTRRVRQDAPEAVVSILSVGAEAATGESEPDAPLDISIMLSGDGEIRLTVECVDAVLTDLSEPWRARGRPHHDG